MDYNVSIYVFTRDIRSTDNLGLISALKNSKTVIPIFIFTPDQTKNNKRFNENCFQFLIESLEELKKEIPVYFFYGDTVAIIKKIINQVKYVNAIYISQDYTKFAMNREKSLEKLGIDLHIISNHTLTNITDVVSGAGTPYSIYSHFRNKFKKSISVNKPIPNTYKNYYTAKLSGTVNLYDMKKFYKENKDIHARGGRKNGLKIINNFKNFKKYPLIRNFPEFSTTNLSAHNKFGTVSIREVYHKIKKAKIHELVDQLIWREFYYNILYHNPDVLKNNYNKKWDKFKWHWSATLFNSWKKGETGFPIVDAGMRQMNHTGFMHNRVRMLAAMFLTKNLHIDWKKGEEYFSKMLVDYDPAQNNGNWQWNAGTGVDPLRYGKPRIMNPWLQQHTYDLDCNYIKKWIPELKLVPSRDIHNWYKKYKEYDVYFEPIVDYKTTADNFIKKFSPIKF